MSLSLYDVSVGTYKQIVPATIRVMKKAVEHCEKGGIDSGALLHEKLYDDMLPLHFQLASVRQHSIGAIEAIVSGQPFNPPQANPKASCAEWLDILQKTREELEAIDPATVDAAVGKTAIFKFGAMELKFKAEDFILSMSLPNFYFHATTAYDILRMKGVKLGKTDFMGRLKLSQ